MMRFFTKVALIAALACGAMQASAQRVLIETATLTAAREAAGMYLHSAMLPFAPDFPPVLLPGPVPLPGSEPLGSLHLSEDERFALASSASRQPGTPHFVTAVRTVPFEALPRWDHLLDAGWRIDAVTTLFAPGIGQRYLITAESRMDGGEPPQLRVATLDPTYPVRVSRQVIVPLPGRAAALAPLPEVGRVAVLCEQRPPAHPDSAAALLHVHDVLGARTIVDAAPLRSDGLPLLNAQPAALALGVERTHLFALVSGEVLHEGGSQPVSRLHVLDAVTGEAAVAPIELPGRSGAHALQPIAAANLHADAHAACWLVTHSPRLRYGHLIRVMLRDGRLVLDVQQPLGGAVAPPLLSVAESLPGTAIVGVGNRVESWPGGLFTGASRSFDGAVAALDVYGGRVVVGEGSRVHALALPTLTPLMSLSMPAGVVRGVHIVSRAGPMHDVDGDGLDLIAEQERGTSPIDPDSSGDGIHDGIDPNPALPTPRLEVPRLIVLQSESIGTEVRAVPIYSEVDADALRIVSVDAEAAPWLLASPRSWRGGGAFYLGVDRAWFGAFQDPTDAQIIVRLIDPITNRDAYGSPAEITVRVLPSRGSVRRILWLVDGVEDTTRLRAGAGPGFGELSRLLASSPLLFSHAVERTALDALTPYSVIVADGAAAARGAILRQVMLDYVAQGGALLFLAGALEGDAARTVARWLQPAGIRVIPGQSVNGAFPAQGDHPLARAWDAFDITGGALLDTVEPAQALASLTVEATGEWQGAVLAVAQYGRGRIAVLAGPDPITDSQMLRAGNRRFAERLFSWLSEAGLDLRGQDALALSPGATAEEVAAGPPFIGDDEPVSFHGAPVVVGAEPAQGPAEGGTPVMIQGRNFSPAAAVYFGEAQAANARYLGPTALRVDTPPSPSGGEGLVAVRVVNPGVSLEGVRTEAFRYTARSVVRLTLQALAAGQGIYNHTVVLTAVDPGFPVGLIAVRLHSDAPPGAVQWGSAARGSVARQGERIVTSVVDASGDVFVTIGRSHPERAGIGGELAVVPVWVDESLAEPVTVSITWNRILAQHGEPLAVDTESASLTPP